MAESCTGQETTDAAPAETPDGTSAREFARLVMEYHNARVLLIEFLRKESHDAGGSLRGTLHSLGADPGERY